MVVRHGWNETGSRLGGAIVGGGSRLGHATDGSLTVIIGVGTGAMPTNDASTITASIVASAAVVKAVVGAIAAIAAVVKIVVGASRGARTGVSRGTRAGVSFGVAAGM